MKKLKKKCVKIAKIKPVIGKYNWEGTNYLLGKDNWKKIEKNNLTIALNILYAKKENVSCLWFRT